MFSKVFIFAFLFFGFIGHAFSYDYIKFDCVELKNNCKIFHLREASVPWDIYVMEVDLTNKNNKSNASRFDSKSGELIGAFIIDGVIALMPDNVSPAPAIWFDQNNVPTIGNLDLNVKIKASNGMEMNVSSVNSVRWLNNLVIYNSFIGDKSVTNQLGAEVLLQPKWNVCQR